MPNFPRIDVEYFREELFNSFSKRLPRHGKRDVTSVLKEYDLKEYDDFELLKKSGGKISTDSFEFISPFKDGEAVNEKEIEEEKEEEIVLDEK